MSASLPLFLHQVTARDIVMGAAASHDWQPQHHDDAYAREMRLPGIIMNTPTQTGWFHAYVRRWAEIRIARWRLQMRRPLAVGACFTLSGKRLRQQSAPPAGRWVWLGLEMAVRGEVASTMLLLGLLGEPGETCRAAPAEALQAPPLGDWQ